jgi:L-amino acid N-acyltransferase YncA
VIRDVEAGDLPSIAAIYSQAVAEGQTAHLETPGDDWWHAWLEQHPPERRPVLVAEREGEVVGWLSIGDYRPGRAAVAGTAEVSMYVDRGHARTGVSSALFSVACERAGKLGIHTLIAILLADNAASVAFFVGHGFARWGELPGVARFEGRAVGHLYYGRDVSGRDREESSR